MTEFLIVTRISNSPQQLGVGVPSTNISTPSVPIGTTGTASFATTVTIVNAMNGPLAKGFQQIVSMTNYNVDISRTWFHAVFSSNPAIDNNHIHVEQTITPPKAIGKR